MTLLVASLLLPVAVGLLAFLGRGVRFLGSALTVGVGLLCLNIAYQAPLTPAVEVVTGLSLELTPLTRLFVLGLWAILTLFGLLELAQPGRSFVIPTTLVSTALAGAALLIRPLALGVLAMQAAALLMVLPALQGPARRPWGSLGYLSVSVIGGAGTLVGLWLANFYAQNPDEGSARSAAMFFAMIAALTLGLAPLHFWLPRLADAAPYQVTAWVGMVAQVTVIGFFFRLILEYEWLLTVTPLFYVLVIGGLLSVTIGGVLSLAASTPRYWLAYSMIYTMGLVVLGLGLFARQGAEGAALALVSRSLALLLATAGFRAAPNLSLKWDDLRGLGQARLAAAIALALAGAAFAGTPPLAGFPGVWVIFRAAYAATPQLAFLMLPGMAFMGLGLVRLLTILFQPDATPTQSAQGQGSARRSQTTPLALSGLILVLILVGLLLGAAPQVVLLPVQSVLETLRFLR